MIASPYTKYERVEDDDEVESIPLQSGLLHMEMTEDNAQTAMQRARVYIRNRWSTKLSNLGACALGGLLVILGFVLGRTRPYSYVPGASYTSFDSQEHSILSSLSHLPKIDLWEEYALNYTSESLYPEPLGKKILIMNVDTRPWDPFPGLQKQTQNAWGWMNHFLYAQIHGYDYKFIQVDPIEDRENYWVKVEGMRKMTFDESFDYQFVIFTDADIIFPDLRLPMEALLSHWNVTSNVAVVAADEHPKTKDSVAGQKQMDFHNNVEINTGFVITQRTPISEELFKAWIECPTDTRYTNCSQFAHRHAHEQSALSSFVRYDPAWPGAVLNIPYKDANNGSGRFIAHHYFGKDHLDRLHKDSIASRFTSGVLELVTQQWSDVGMDLRAKSNSTSG